MPAMLPLVPASDSRVRVPLLHPAYEAGRSCHVVVGRPLRYRGGLTCFRVVALRQPRALLALALLPAALAPGIRVSADAASPPARSLVPVRAGRRWLERAAVNMPAVLFRPR